MHGVAKAFAVLFADVLSLFLMGGKSTKKNADNTPATELWIFCIFAFYKRI